MFSKRGQVFAAVVFPILAVLALVIFLASYLDESASGKFPDAIANTIDVVHKIAEPIGKALFIAVVPSSLSEDQQYIAFALFLLVWVVGSYSLANVSFFGSFSSFFISGIIAMIGSRSLTDEIIKSSALQAGPLTTMLLILGIFPLLVVKGILDKMYRRNAFLEEESSKSRRYGHLMARMAIWLFLAMLYMFVVTLLIPSSTTTDPLLRRTLGEPIALVYGIGTLIFGWGDTLLVEIKKKKVVKQARDVGRFMAVGRRIRNFFTRAKAGADEAASREFDASEPH